MVHARSIRAISTSDVSLEALRDFRDQLAGDVEVMVDSSQVFLMSAEPPSWLALLAEAPWWIKALGAYAALFVAKIVEEAAKETWKNRGKAFAAGVDAANRVKRVAIAMFNLKPNLPPRTRLEIGVPVPDDYFATRLTLDATDPDNLTLQIALFVHHLPALMGLVEQKQLSRGCVAAGIHLELLGDGSLEVSWQDNASFKQLRHVLPLKDDSAA